jgi:hypothetical protein
MDLVNQLNKLIKDECKTCKINTNNRCVDCNFILNGNRNIYVGKEIRKLGVPLIEKHKFYYFLYNPELNWKFPLLPDFDYNEKYIKNMKQLFWVVHHEDGNHYNDNKWNLILMLNNEHQQLHRLEKPYIKNPIYKYEKVKNLELFLTNITEGLHLIDKQLIKNFNYSRTDKFINGVRSIIKRINKDVFLIHNNKNGGHRKWFLCKNNIGE